MSFFEHIPSNYNISLTFIVLIVAVLTVYMAVRCIRRIDLVTVGAFIVQLCMLTTGVLTVAKRVMTIPAYEITLILFGILIPGTFLVFDYVNMKKRIKISNADVPLIERVEKQSNKDWTYKEYVETAEEWKTEIPYNTIVKTLNIGDKQLKSNLINQLSAVHKLIDVRDYKKALDNYMILTGILNHNPYIVYNAGWLYYRNGQYDDAIKMYKNSLNLIGEDANTKKDKKEDTEFNLRPILYFACGLCLYYQKKYELAIDQFELAQKDAGAIREVEINIAR